MERNRRDIVTAAFANAGPGAAYGPIRVQILLFLIDRAVADRIGGPFFDFQPGLYGPLDVAVYDELVGMAAAGDALIDETGRYPRYVLTGAGRAKGEAMLRPGTRLPPTTSGVRRGGFS